MTRLPVTGVILAGGRGSRMGGEDKGLINWHSQPLYQHVPQRLRPQVTAVWINANRNIEVYQHSGVPVIRDTLADFPGPLAGILAALQQAETDWVVFTSCDTPCLPENMAQRLWRHKGKARAVWVRTEVRDHPTQVLLHRSLADPLQQYLTQGNRKLMLFLQQAGGHSVLFAQGEPAFRNFNHPEDLLQAAEAKLRD
ncbi:molybdenum cofactor guanylyltransferase MobA [Erwinia amylovora]|uniref:molybdenum cofactor guanylyltransferase MobA n=1 Tax=Erwinia amylovora TaxID=552 RepID=UPI00200AE204|nr:molybdenum cofactor guanylyltransferase MobA [Erwinia amylovora]MCK8187773.1 molybdenum cofactor guanylyltransferase MobA [Erwinia amylovora]MCK8245068.1 molybdenum cofactor guanylyltransferase MobA [Erwinia amylovora]MCK8248506.1 molybdenum cofactor guanylyltransferase MobA [Erwinia amylovora]MCK8251726.1 molybdenum cofactor guanylyltransferase MobA [Erwinia amylovora]MCK8268764.1 molybdenum cofactor guanylyltransferase MobA [Erwinia amylovora]